MPQHGGRREGSGRTPLPENEKKIPKTIYITPTLQTDIDKFAAAYNLPENYFTLEIARQQSNTAAFGDTNNK